MRSAKEIAAGLRDDAYSMTVWTGKGPDYRAIAFRLNQAADYIERTAPPAAETHTLSVADLPTQGHVPAPSSRWRPISEAPKDGTYVLLNFDNRPPTVARWLYGAWQAFDVLGFIGAPTHWQPLPLPPTEISDNG